MALYSASVSAIAGALIPKKLVASNSANRARLAATTEGCTTVQWVNSNAAVTVSTEAAISWHCCAVVRNQSRYGSNAWAIAIEDGPRQVPVSDANSEA